ncbi:MAG: response regulator transcription factor, partial [Lachnospiraceae bacterium]|nr:response regulator transcription factor [Lachnospiraceae bacterium]
IEDDLDFSYSLCKQLEEHDFETDTCQNGSDALFYINQETYHLILLDRMLPVLDGMHFLQIIRQQGIMTPVIFITGLGELSEKIVGLNGGADDYLVKPFAFEELLARIYCILRRPPALKTKQPISLGDLTYHPTDKKLCCGSKSCMLTTKENALLELFLDHPNQTLTRDFIFFEIWGTASDVEDRNLDNFIYFLRNRIRSIGSTAVLKTIRGTGYQLVV